MKKIKILMCGLNSQIGGIEIFILNYIKKINFCKFQIDFINVYDENIQTEYYNELKKYGNVYYLANYRTNPLKFSRQIKELQKKNNYDIFHYHMASCAYLVPLLAAKRAKIKKIIAHAHNDASDKGIIKEFVHQINKRLLPILSNCYFACSENAAQWFFKKKIYSNKKYNIIENAIDVEKFLFDNNKRKELRKELQIFETEKVYGHVGNFKKIKNHQFLIDVFFEIQKIQPNSKLILIGEGNTKFNIQKKVQELGLEKKVIFLGQKNNVNDYLSIMDVFLFPSKHEGLGISYIEAQISGLPCLVSDGVPKEADLTKNMCRLHLSNPNIWAQKAVDFSNSELRQFNVNNCKYDINYSSKKLENIYHEMVKVKVVHFVYGIRNGGVEKVLTSYFSNMNRDILELHIITQGKSDEKNLKEFIDLGFFVHNVTQKKQSILKNFIDIISILKEYEFDIAHCHMSNTNFFPLLYSLISGIKIRINHSHNAFACKGILERLLMYIANFLCTDKMACSEDAAYWLFGSTDKVHILKNAIYTEKFTYDKKIRNEYRMSFNIDKDDYVIGMVARFEEQKNHNFILEVFNEVIQAKPNIKVIFIGVGPLEEEIKKKVIDSGLNEKILFLSSRNDVNKLYSVFDLFVLPSLYEGLGIVLVEAQISGLKCLTSNFVPKTVNFSGNVEFLDLNISLWKKNIIDNMQNIKRENNLLQSNLAGYNIIEEAKLLEKKYLELYRKG